MRSVFQLLALLLVAVLAAVVPAGAPGSLDLHAGQALHLAFSHAHPDASTDQGLRVGLTAQPELRAATALQPVGSTALEGQLLPSRAAFVAPSLVLGRLAAASAGMPVALLLTPLDPPPERA